MARFGSRAKAAAAVALAVVMTACSSAGTSTSPAASPPAGASGSPAAPPSADATPVTLTFWADPSYGPGARGLPDVKVVGDYEQQLIDAFRETHPNVTINVQINPYEDVTTKTTAAIAAGTPPDLIRTTSARQFDWNELAPDLVYDLRDLLPAETIAAFPEDYVAITTAPDGKLYGLQAYGVPIHLAANRALFEEAGVPYPESGAWTREDFEAACAKLVKKDRWCIAHQFSQPDARATLQFLYASGGDVVSPDGKCTFNSPEAVETFEWLKSLDAKGYFIPGAANLQYEDPLTAQLEGRTVIYASGNTSQRTRLKEADAEGRAIDNWLWAPLPLPQKVGADNVGKGLYVATAGFQAFKSSDDPVKKQALADFLDYQLSPERNAEMGYAYGGIPARSDAAPPPDADADVDLVYKWVQEYGFNNTLDRNPALFNALGDTFVPEMQAMWLGEKSVQEGLDALQTVCETALAG